MTVEFTHGTSFRAFTLSIISPHRERCAKKITKSPQQILKAQTVIVPVIGVNTAGCSIYLGQQLLITVNSLVYTPLILYIAFRSFSSSWFSQIETKAHKSSFSFSQPEG